MLPSPSATLGTGDTGNIMIEARDRVSFVGDNTTTFSNTAVFSSVGRDAQATGIRKAYV